MEVSGSYLEGFPGILDPLLKLCMQQEHSLSLEAQVNRIDGNGT